MCWGRTERSIDEWDARSKRGEIDDVNIFFAFGALASLTSGTKRVQGKTGETRVWQGGGGGWGIASGSSG